MRGEEKREGFPRKPALRRSEKGFRGSRQLSKAVSTPPGAAETAPGKRERFPQKPATFKSRPNAPRDRRNGSGEARRVSAEAGISQKPPQRPPGPRKRLRGSEKVFPVAGISQKPPHCPRLRGGVFPSPPFCQLSPRVILADYHTYRYLKEVNPLKAVAGREVI